MIRILLKKYYYDNGYIDFRIVSVNSSLVDNRKDFVVIFLYLKEIDIKFQMLV